MANGIVQVVRRAYLPYARGFLDQPQEARIEFVNDDRFVHATLLLAQADFNRFDREVELRAEQRRSFNNLVREWDDRTPALRFRQRS